MVEEKRVEDSVVMMMMMTMTMMLVMMVIIRTATEPTMILPRVGY